MKHYNIVAPVCSPGEVESILKSGAGEVYFGIMTDSWVKRYGNSDFISRRQSEITHISSYGEMSEIVEISRKYNSRATLVLNSRYSQNQLTEIYEIIEQWEVRGGDSVMVSDIEILLWLNNKGSKLKRHLSVMAGTFNSRSAAFFHRLNVSRIVLPREMSVTEICRFMQGATGDMEYEVIVMFQKCEFIDSFCGFYHSFNYHPFIENNYTGASDTLPVIASYDPVYEGHGCQLDFFCKKQKIKHLKYSDMTTPFCAACSLNTFLEAGVTNFKLAGRGYPLDLIVRSVGFIKQTLSDNPVQASVIRDNYRLVFGSQCLPENCYYQ